MMTELLLPFAMIAGWIGFAMLLGGFLLIIMGYAKARGFLYPFSMVLASLAYGIMNFALGVWPGFWANVFFLLISGVACLAAIGRRKTPIEDDELDAMCDEIEGSNR